MFIVQVGVSIMLPLLPLYATSLGATPTVLGLLTSSFAILIAVGQLAGGYLVERVAPRRLVSIGIVTYAAANVLINLPSVDDDSYSGEATARVMGVLDSIEEIVATVHSGVRGGEAREPLEPAPDPTPG